MVIFDLADVDGATAEIDARFTRKQSLSRAW